MRDRVRAVIAAALATVLAMAPTGARAQADVGIKGRIEGTLVRGSRAGFRIEATHADGWRSLAEIRAILELRGVPLEEIDYEVDEGVIRLGATRAVLGTGDGVAGRFLAVEAIGVRVTTGGSRLALEFRADVLNDVPDGGSVRFVAEDDSGREASALVKATRPEAADEGLPLGTVALVVGAALVAGGFIGARTATHRRARGSVYATVARRLEESRTPPRR